MKRTINLFKVEILLILLGIITIIAGLCLNYGTNKDTNSIIFGVALCAISVATWTASAISVAFKYQLEPLIEEVFRKKQSIKVVKEDDLYKAARADVLKAKHVKATFFVDGLWELQPGERGYGKKEDGSPNSEKEESMKSYFKILETRINKGELEYHWIIYINSFLKYQALVDRILTIISSNPRAVTQKTLSIHVWGWF